MDSLFKIVSRDERQEEVRQKWIKNKCKGTLVAATGFGRVWTGYISVNVSAVPIEKSSELLSGNIGETPEMDNTEINSETKESESSYSVDSEPHSWEYNLSKSVRHSNIKKDENVRGTY